MRTPIRYIILLLTLATGVSTVDAQSFRKTLNAAAAGEKIIIDGRLTEAIWQKAEKAVNFIQLKPEPGQPATKPTAVSILYDDEAVYVGAMLYDDHPDNILRQFSARDDDGGNTDEFGVTFDTYFDNQNATSFLVTAAGVQVDAIVKFDGINTAWNAAWYSAVAITDSGWSVEMKIPYSALRFPKKEVQLWGVNFVRSIRRYREYNYWNAVSPNVANILSQSGLLNGIHDVVAPLRLSLLPYVSAYAQNYAGHNAQSLNGGMDVKYGFNESFTLDMTLVPDFGQTIYDNKVLNLSPIEVKYDERRYFFTEGLDLFNKNDLFYSRRVGGTPVNYSKPYVALDSNERVIENPVNTRLYNATKISGRTKTNLGIGFFNAVSAPANATLQDTFTFSTRKLQTSPLTNYNVLVLDQALKNNSYISFVNTNVARNDNTYNADVTALLFKFANKKNTYGVDGSGDMSQLYKAGKDDVGYRYYLNFGKLSGNNTWDIRTRSITDRFNPNDLGYLDRNNITYYQVDEYYNTYKPFGIFNTTYNHVGIDYYRVYNPNAFMQAEIFGSHSAILRNYLYIGAYWVSQPFKINDYFEPRTPGRYYVRPQNYTIGATWSSDYRKKFALDGEINYKGFSEANHTTRFWSLSPRYRFSNKFSMIYSIDWQLQQGDVGFVNKVGDSIYLGVRKINTMTNTIDAAYIFTNKMSLKLAARHYWSQAEYSRYNLLMADGKLANTTYNTNHDINFNSFNVYMSYIWQFRPGSEMSVVYQNSIYSVGQNIETNYFNDVNNTIQTPASNSLSVKVIYYLDYLELRNVFHKNI
ncbi:MAG: hypothetical protein JWQ38_2838 [Flavipsychrobacter sp.]|nr:hypothetical protein [Flavipsychrobacter sp.]